MNAADLATLADLDRQRSAIREASEHLPAANELNEVNARLSRLAVELGEVKKERDPLEARRRDLDEQVQNHSARLAELRRRLDASVGGGRELEALSSEIEQLTALLDELETAELELLELLEPHDANLASIQGVGQMLMERRVELSAMVDAERSALAEQVAALDAPRTEAASRVDAPLLARYERILARVKDVAAVRVIDGRCTGCRIEAVAHDLALWNAATAEQPMECPECGRLWLAPGC